MTATLDSLNGPSRPVGIFLNTELSLVCNWLNVNVLKLNKEKTKALFMSTKSNVTQFKARDQQIYIENEKINFVTSIKYLSIITDEELKFKEHINFVIKKLQKSVTSYTEYV